MSNQKQILYHRNVELSPNKDFIKVQDIDTSKGFVCESKTMKNILKDIDRWVSFADDLHIEGETGTGKEHIARYYAEKLKNHGFTGLISVSCAEFSDKEKFFYALCGSVAGAFTDVGENEGLLERSHREKKILFLDEIHHLTRESQTSLLRLLESRMMRKLGGVIDHPFVVPIVTASNQSLQQLANNGHFYPDLYYRISKKIVSLAPLQDRPEDKEALIHHFVHSLGQERMNSTITWMPKSVYDMLMHSPYNGHVRDLKNHVMEKMIEIKEASEGFNSLGEATHETTTTIFLDLFINTSFKEAMHNITLLKVVHAMSVAKGDKKKATEVLSISTKCSRASAYRYVSLVEKKEIDNQLLSLCSELID